MAPTLYEWAGGSDAFRRLIDAFYDCVEHDGLIAPPFPGGVSEQHRAHVTTWWIEHAPVPRWGWGVAPPYQPS